jgi:alpha/beta superfamily hydrolase
MLAQVSGADSVTAIDIRAGVELPAKREEIELHTADGLVLVGELATPVTAQPVATILTLHPLPTHGGFMDSHVIRKASNRLPALVDYAVLRFNTRGTESPRGKSQGEFDGGKNERFDVEAALAFVAARNLPNVWLLGWSFGTELALKYGADKNIQGAILLSPPLHRTSEEELKTWVGSGKQVVAIVPEFDDYLTPEPARQRFSVIPQAKVIGIEGAKHLWVGENATKAVLDEVVRVISPQKAPLPTIFEG